MKKILMTCFTPFGGSNYNSSLEITKAYCEKANNINIIYVLLPVTLNESFSELDKQIKKEKPDYIVLSGMATSRKVITLENEAHNILDFKIPDNNNIIISNKPIVKNDVDTLYTKLNLSIFDNSISYDAGKYICNYIYYMTLYNYPNIPSVFIHYPALNDTFTKELGIKFLESFINKITKMEEI